MTATNGAGIGQAESYRGFIETILREDPAELFIRSLEGMSEDKQSTSSCLGLLTMINDYHALPGWRFAVDAGFSNAVMVTTRVALPFQSLPGAITS